MTNIEHYADGTMVNLETGSKINTSSLGGLVWESFYNEPAYVKINLSDRKVTLPLLSALADLYIFFNDVGVEVVVE